MALDRLPASVLALYAELLELEQIGAAQVAAESVVPGTFVSKRIKGGTYWYLQRSEGPKVRQHYLGRDSAALRAWMTAGEAAFAARREDAAARRSLAAMLQKGGAISEPAGVLKVLQVLAQAGVFRLGGVLIGTQAFRSLGNVLGVRLAGATARTQDIDVATDPSLAVALAGSPPRADVARRLGELEPPFLPVPGLDPRSPSTTFMVRGRQFRVDFLTPGRRAGEEQPVFLGYLGCAAQPVRFLEYLLGEAIPAVVVGGSSVLVAVPDPARYALHKLYTATARGPSQHTKSRKDIAQAIALLEVLAEDRPADVTAAWLAIASRTMRRAVAAGVAAIDADLQARLRPLLLPS